MFSKQRFGCKILVLRTDGGGEYQNVDLFCKTTGVARQISERVDMRAPQKVEGMHRTVLNMARSMISACNMPPYFWGDAV